MWPRKDLKKNSKMFQPDREVVVTCKELLSALQLFGPMLMVYANREGLPRYRTPRSLWWSEDAGSLIYKSPVDVLQLPLLPSSSYETVTFDFTHPRLLKCDVAGFARSIIFLDPSSFHLLSFLTGFTFLGSWSPSSRPERGLATLTLPLLNTNFTYSAFPFHRKTVLKSMNDV